MKTLYKIDNANRVRQWSIEQFDDKFRTITGLVDGKKVTNEWTKAIPTNVGRVNERNGDAQASFEIESLITDKVNEGYRFDMKEAQIASDDFEVMLAKIYNGWNKLNESKVYSQPKLDGIRCVASLNGLYSRNKKEIVSVSHIIMKLGKFFYDYPHIVLDGELYNHDLKDNFNKISSLVRKTKNITVEDVVESAEIVEYHIYDMYSTSAPNMTFEERNAFLLTLGNYFDNTPIKIVDSNVCESEDQLLEFYQEYLADGYEGQMIRIPSSIYDQKRSKNLLKRKPFHESGGIEEEMEIINVVEGKGNWSGKAKSIECKMANKNLCSASIKGTMQFAEKVWLNKADYIGNIATVMYQNLTPDGKPRFPIATDLNRTDIDFKVNK